MLPEPSLNQPLTAQEIITLSGQSGTATQSAALAQADLLINQYERILHQNPYMLLEQLPRCLTVLLKEKQTDLIERLLEKILTGPYSDATLFQINCRLQCLNAILSEHYTSPSIERALLQLWNEFKTNPAAATRLLRQAPGVMSSLPMLRFLTARLKISENVESALNLLQTVCGSLPTRTTLLHDVILDELFKTLLELHSTAAQPRILATIMHLSQFDIIPRANLLTQWLAAMTADMNIDLGSESKQQLNRVLTNYLIAAPKLIYDTLTEPYIDRLLALNQDDVVNILVDLIKPDPSRGLDYLLTAYEHKRCSLDTLLAVCCDCPEISLQKNQKILVSNIAHALNSDNIYQQRLATRLMVHASFLIEPTLDQLAGDEHWNAILTLLLTQVCGHDREKVLTFDNSKPIETKIQSFLQGCTATTEEQRFRASTALSSLMPILSVEKHQEIWSFLKAVVLDSKQPVEIRIDALNKLREQAKIVPSNLIAETIQFLEAITQNSNENFSIRAHAFRTLGEYVQRSPTLQKSTHLQTLLSLLTPRLTKKLEESDDESLIALLHAFGSFSPFIVPAQCLLLIELLRNSDFTSAQLIQARNYALGQLISSLPDVQLSQPIQYLMKYAKSMQFPIATQANTVLCQLAERLKDSSKIQNTPTLEDLFIFYKNIIQNADYNSRVAARLATGVLAQLEPLLPPNDFPTIVSTLKKCADNTELETMLRVKAIKALATLSSKLSEDDLHYLLNHVQNTLIPLNWGTPDPVIDCLKLILQAHSVQHLPMAFELLCTLLRFPDQTSKELYLLLASLPLSWPQYQEVQRIISAAPESKQPITPFAPLNTVKNVITCAENHVHINAFVPVYQTLQIIKIDYASWFNTKPVQQEKAQPVPQDQAQPEQQRQREQQTIPPRPDAALAELLIHLRAAESVPAGVSVLMLLIEFGLYQPCADFLETAFSKPQLNYEQQCTIIQLLTVLPEVDLTEEQYLSVLLPVYLDPRSSTELCLAIEQLAFEKKFLLPISMLTKCLERAALDSNPFSMTRQLILSRDLTALSNPVLAELHSENAHVKTRAMRYLQLLPISSLIDFATTYKRSPITTDFYKLLLERLNQSDGMALERDLKLVSLPELLTFFQSQQHAFNARTHDAWISVMKEKIASQPWFIHEQQLILADKKLPLPDELRPALVAQPTPAMTIRQSGNPT
jgi:hypothetical protein